MTDQELIHVAQELAGLGALNDAMVVGRGQGGDFGDAQAGDPRGVNALEFRRIVNGADAENDTLAAHESRHRMIGANTAGVGQRGCGTGEVGYFELAASRLLDERLIGLPETGEVEIFAVLDIGNQQLPGAIGLL